MSEQRPTEQRPTEPRPSSRLALGGIVGPAAFIGAWAVLGATRSGYSPISGHISDLGALGTTTRAGMTAGFVVYGLGLPMYGAAAYARGRRVIGALAVVTGLSTLAVAAFPLGTASDRPHVISAAIGYVTLAAIPIVGAVHSWRSGRRTSALVSAAVALASGAALVASLSGPQGGLWQRTGLTLSDLWVAGHAIALLRPGRGDKAQ